MRKNTTKNLYIKGAYMHKIYAGEDTNLAQEDREPLNMPETRKLDEPTIKQRPDKDWHLPLTAKRCYHQPLTTESLYEPSSRQKEEMAKYHKQTRSGRTRQV